MKKIKYLVLIILVFGCCACSTSQEVLKETPPSIGLFDKFQQKAMAYLETMSLEEKLGQLFLIRFDENQLERDLSSIAPSGYVLFAKDFEGETPTSISEKLAAYQSQSKTPLVFAVDEEGGFVTRVSRFPAFRSSKFKGIRDYYLEGGISKLVEIEEEKINLLSSLGINLNLAPVVDVSTKEEDFIYNRTLGEDVSIVKDFIQKVVDKAKEKTFAVTLKHFPGYGENVDTHTGISLDKRTKEELEKNSLPPFLAGIEAKAPVIMLSHNIVESYDSKYPASLSKAVHEKLRSFGFTGLIVTDDLDMQGLQDCLKGQNEAVLSFLAGNDWSMTSNYEEDMLALKEAIINGEIKEREIDERVLRVLAFKYQYKIL